MESDDADAYERVAVIARLRAMPERLRAALQHGGAVSRGSADEDEWTARDVFDHIRATDMLHSAEIFMIIAAPEPALPGGDER